jgi:hypothetical protein
MTEAEADELNVVLNLSGLIQKSRYRAARGFLLSR